MSNSESEVDNLNDEDFEEQDPGNAAEHAASIKRLKSKDPDFYEFLKENDKDLLNFEASDEDEEDDDEGEEEVAKETIAPQKIRYIKDNIGNAPTAKLCKELMSAFKAAVHQAEGSDAKVDMKNSELFNDIVKLCLIELAPALIKVLNLTPPEEDSKKMLDPSKSKQWKSMYPSIKSYLIYMLKMFSIFKESSMLTLLLKHTVHLIPFYCTFIKLSRNLVKKMIAFWSREEETIRVLSLIIIVRTTKSFSKEYLNQVLKEMYFSYIKNTKFTSPSTWPMINFMKRSLTEVYSLYPDVAYEHAFVYIRQMSIHLRNALTTKKKENFQTVYNWQYTHCILLWSHLLCKLYEHEAVKSLIYPLVQTTIGTINLIPTTRFIPLRFHLVRALMHISESTGTYIPILPFVLGVLKLMDYNKKSNFSVKPVDFSCALKATKSQLTEVGFKETCISSVCDLLVDYLQIYGSSIGFPELALPAVIQIKAFMKQCRVSKYNQKLKAVLIKIEETAQFISDKRRAVTFSINDLDEVKRWEATVGIKGAAIFGVKREKEEAPPQKEEGPPKKKRKQFRPRKQRKQH